jgi:hypothetical protein
MDLISRAKNICLTPTAEWPVIASEETPAATLITSYVLPLAAVGAVAGFLGGSLVGYSLPFAGTYRVPIVTGLVGAVVALVFAIAVTYLVSLIVNALAPTFGGQKDPSQAFKVVAYSYTPAWVAGVLQIIPMLGVLGVLAALYGIYLLYLGLPRLMQCPEDRAVGYTAVTVVCAIVLSMVVGGISTAAIGVGAIGSGLTGRGASAARPDPDSMAGRLQSLGQQLEQNAAQAEQAGRRGDTQGQLDAAMNSLGAILGGGRRVEPLDLEALKPFTPESLAGLRRTSSRAERTDVAPLVTATVAATYGDANDRAVDLEIADSGGLSGLTAVASWTGTTGERQDASGSERTYRQDGRLIRERASRIGGPNEISLVLGDRFVVTARSRTLDLETLKAAVGTLDLARLEAMKDAGIAR